MDKPSIEISLSRKNRSEGSYPIAKRLEAVPVAGSLARAWVKATRPEGTRSLWASLPPLVRA